MTQQDLGV